MDILVNGSVLRCEIARSRIIDPAPVLQIGPEITARVEIVHPSPENAWVQGLLPGHLFQVFPSLEERPGRHHVNGETGQQLVTHKGGHGDFFRRLEQFLLDFDGAPAPSVPLILVPGDQWRKVDLGNLGLHVHEILGAGEYGDQ